MHEYYAKNRETIKSKMMDDLLKRIAPELEELCGKPYAQVLDEVWDYYETELLERFPYIGGDDVSGTTNLTGAYCYVAMGEVLKRYGADMNLIAQLMTQSYERKFKVPGVVRGVVGLVMGNTKLLTRVFAKRNAANAANAAVNPGSFETATQEPPEDGYDFSYHNLVCPLANFAAEHGYEEYMPYLCNLDYVMFGQLGVPLYREKTCASGDAYCDFKLKKGAPVLAWWPPVFTQDNEFK